MKPEEFKKIREIRSEQVLLSMARKPESRTIFCGAWDGAVYPFDVSEEKPAPKPMEQHSGYVTGVAISDDVMVSGAYDKSLTWWDYEKRESIQSFKAHDKWVRGVEISSDGKLVASVADDMVCRLWNVRSRKLVRELKGHESLTPTHFNSMLYCCAFAPDGLHLATADKVGHVVVWEVATGKQVKSFEAPVFYTWDPRARRHSIGGIRSLAFSPDGAKLAVGGMGKVGNIDHLGGKARVELFNWEKGEKLGECESGKFKGLVERLAWHPEGDWILAGGGDHKGYLIFISPDGKKTLSEEQLSTHVHDFSLSKGADRIVTVGHQRIEIWG